MASVLMHMMVGVFVGLAAGVRLRHWPALAFLAEWIDLDHAFAGAIGAPSPIWMLPRGTFHNVFVVFVIPAGLAAYVYWNKVGDHDVQRILTALPAVMGSHLVFDLIKIPSGDAGWAYAFYPFSLQKTGISVSRIIGDPSYVGPEAIGMAIAFALALIAGVLTRRVDVEEDIEIEKTRVAVYLFVFVFAMPLGVLAFGQAVVL